jgi:hypothetical protein
MNGERIMTNAQAALIVAAILASTTQGKLTGSSTVVRDAASFIAWLEKEA